MVKLVHFAIISGDRYDVETLGNALKKVKADLNNEYEFLITGDRIIPRDPRDLLEEYKALLNSFQELVDEYKEKEKEIKEEEKQ